MSEIESLSVFESCTAQYTTDELDSLLQCISDGSAEVSKKKTVCFDRNACLCFSFLFDSFFGQINDDTVQLKASLIMNLFSSFLVIICVFLFFFHTSYTYMHPFDDDTHIHTYSPTHPRKCTQTHTHDNRQLPLLHKIFLPV